MAVHFLDVPATFIHVPKTGGTSFYHWIEENICNYEKPIENKYATGSILGAEKKWGDLGIIFSFVRNPYSRLVSMYEHQYSVAQKEIKGYYLNKGMSDSYIDHLKLISVAKKGFNYWLECVCYDKPEIYNIYDGNPNQI